MFPRFLFLPLKQPVPLKTVFNRTNFISVNTERPLMRFNSFIRLSIIAAITITVFSCNKKEEFITEPLSDYIPLVKGKYITYRLDSMVFTNFGRTTQTHGYQVKHSIDSLITDNLGRPTYRVYRYLRDSLGTQPWQAAGSYFVTPLSDQIELVEDNLRFIKLHLPVRDGNSWKGNKYLPANPYGSLYNFSNDDNMEDWDYFFDGESSTFSSGGQNYTNVYSIEEINESFNVPISNPSAYAARSRAVERYSKNIGLVYKELELWEYQPNPGGSGGPYKTGFGIKMWMIGHN